MVDDSSKKQFQYVLVYQLDRFARNRFDSATYKAKLSPYSPAKAVWMAYMAGLSAVGIVDHAILLKHFIQ